MLEQFPHIVDVDISAQMEKNLDKVESGKADWRKTVDDFYQDVYKRQVLPGKTPCWRWTPISVRPRRWWRASTSFLSSS